MFGLAGMRPGEQGRRNLCSLSTVGIACLMTVATFTVAMVGPGQANAQVQISPPRARPNPLPKANYYLVFPDFYQGEYRRSLKNYQTLLRTAYKDVNGSFLDSVCYLTMMGECYYHMGNYAKAIDVYEQAIKVYISRSRWEPRTQIPPTIAPNKTAVQRAKINWYSSARSTTIGTYPRNYSYLIGRLDNERVLGTGGAIQNPEARPVDIVEAMRCCALALHRRREIKGATCKVDPLTRQIEQALTSQQLTPTNVVGAWKGVLAGIALASSEEYTKAAAMLKKSMQVGGRFDHPLTPIAMCELGKIAFAAGKYSDARTLFLEASHSAATFEQYDLIEHSLRWASKANAMESPGTLFTPLQNAIPWAAREKAKFIQASLTVELAHNYAELGNSVDASSLLSQAKRPMARNDISASTVSGRMWYVSALAKFQQGKSGMADFARFLKQFQTAGSTWTYQLSLADALVVSKRVNSRDADALYSRLLREPTAADWQAAPMETMTYLATPHLEPLERWFEIVIDQRKVEKAIEIAEAIRRHRFYANLPLGGRLMAFRGLLEAPEDTLNADDLKIRKEILRRFGNYKALSQTSENIQTELAKLPLAPASATPESKKQKELLTSLAAATSVQETMLGSMALMRLPSAFSFPPKTDLKSAQSKLDEKQVVIYCVGTRFNFHVFLIARGTYGHIGPIQPAVLRRGISLLLKDIGSVDRNAGVPIEVLQGDKWKETSQKIMDVVLPKRNDVFWQQFDEAIIVPDDAAWYLPWELLQVQATDQTKNLAEMVRIRYLPTLGLAVADYSTPRKFDKTAVVIGKLSAKDSSEKTMAEFRRLQAASPGAESFTSKLNGPSSLLSSVFDSLIVWTENKDAAGFGMSLMQVDKGKPGSTLANWMALPWRGPQHVVMPGFSSGAASGGRSRSYGNDLYLTSCALMAAGSRTILISRWRVGGTTSLVVTREFMSQLPENNAIDAWKRAVKIVSNTELDIESESRIRSGQTDQPIMGSHPFFWAGYLLVDTGSDLEKAEEKDAKDDAPPAEDPKKEELKIGEGKEGDAKKGDAKKGDAKKDDAKKDDAKEDKGKEKKDKDGDAKKDEAKENNEGKKGDKKKEMVPAF